MSIESNIVLPSNGWKPKKYQANAWANMRDPKKKTIILAEHRRWGKDELALHDSAIRIMQRVGNYWHMLPKQDQARRAIWDAVNPDTQRRRWIDAFPREIISHIDHQSMMISFVNGSTWQVLGSDNYETLVGSSPVHIVYSESALADPNAAAYFNPILLANGGTSLHISSVRGKNHFYRLYKNYEGREDAYVEKQSAEETTVFTQAQLSEELQNLKNQHGDVVGTAIFRQEYLSDWDAQSQGAIFIKSLTDMSEQGRLTPLPYDPRYPVNTSWDIGIGDDTVILFWQNIGGVERLIDWYAGTDLGIDTYAEVLHNKPYKYGVHIAPHDIKQREWGGRAQTRIDIARNYGIKFTPMPKISKAESIAAGDMLLRRAAINIIEDVNKEPTDDCALIYDMLLDYKFKFNNLTKAYTTTPEHNRASNYADALMYYALYASGTSGVSELEGFRPQNNMIDKFETLRLRDVMARQRNQRNGGFPY